MVIVLDQVSKWLAGLYVAAKVIPVIPGFVFLKLEYNPGIIFGFFRDYQLSFIFWLILSLTALFGLIYFSIRIKEKLQLVALGLLAGGIFGNLLDRIFRGGVLDFVDVRIGTFAWPTFNIADLSITLGVIFTIYHLFAIRRFS